MVKPAGLVCELPRNPLGDSLVRRLAHEGYPGLRLVHRLDAPACGLMLIARSAPAAAHFSREIEARRWHKWYVARVSRRFHSADPLIGTHKVHLRTEGRSARVVRAGGRPAILDVVTAAPVPGAADGADLLIRLHTGRFHQIRATLAHLGAPLTGDRVYGGPPAPRLYLEQVLLAARTFAEPAWRIWRAPSHPDRPAWHGDLARAVESHAAALGAALLDARR